MHAHTSARAHTHTHTERERGWSSHVMNETRTRFMPITSQDYLTYLAILFLVVTLVSMITKRQRKLEKEIYKLYINTCVFMCVHARVCVSLSLSVCVCVCVCANTCVWRVRSRINIKHPHRLWTDPELTRKQPGSLPHGEPEEDTEGPIKCVRKPH